MSVPGRLVTLFPFAFFGLLLSCIVWLAIERSPWPIFAFLAVAYLLPPIAFRLHELIAPLKDGSFALDEPAYVPWWGSHQLQLPYDAVPAFEAILRVIPGAYSAWLRLWGSRIGRGVYWTPAIELLDRSRVVVGDHVVFGHRVAIYPHVIRKRKDSMRLMLRTVEIGSHVFLGAGTRLGPGSKVPSGSIVPLLTDIWVGLTFEQNDTLETEL